MISCIYSKEWRKLINLIKKLLIWHVGRPIIHIGSIGTGPIDPFWNLGSAPITHRPYFCGSGQLPNGSTRPISIHTHSHATVPSWVAPRVTTTQRTPLHYLRISSPSTALPSPSASGARCGPSQVDVTCRVAHRNPWPRVVRIDRTAHRRSRHMDIQSL